MGCGLSLRPSLDQDLGLNQELRLERKLRQSQQLSLEQRLEQTLAHHLELRAGSGGNISYYVSIMTPIWGHSMLPSARCEHCPKSLSVPEILKGFLSDVNDFTTQCPQCKRRLPATNLVDSRGTERPFWCAAQTLERLPALQALEVGALREQQPQIYFSALFHFGSLVSAFKSVQIVYKHKEFDWGTKARLCLGKLPDLEVSRLFGVKLHAVVAMRKQLKIPASRKVRLFPADQVKGLVE